MCVAINSSGRPRCPPSPTRTFKTAWTAPLGRSLSFLWTQHNTWRKHTHAEDEVNSSGRSGPEVSSLMPFHISECDFSLVRVFWYFWCCKTFAGYIYLLEWSRFENRVAQLRSSIINSTSNFMAHFFKKMLTGLCTLTAHDSANERKNIYSEKSSFPVWPGELVTPAGMSLHQDAKNICTFQAQWKRHSNQNSAGVILLTSYGRRIKTDIMTALKSPRTRRLVTGTR